MCFGLSVIRSFTDFKAFCFGGSSRNPGRLSRTEDSSVNLQTRESEPKCVLESVLRDEAHE
jgi:hypothetical protein